MLALLGATQDSFAAAADVLERRTLVTVAPNTVRAATEDLGQVLLTQQATAVARVRRDQLLPTVSAPAPSRLYISMDGVLAHLHTDGWSEVKVGCCYTTTTRPDRVRPEQITIHAEAPSYLATLQPAAAFGEQLWYEAARRGVLTAAEVIVLGDGAHWIWNLATEYFPEAIQILDWYHASSYLWLAATTIWGETGSQRAPWAYQQLDRLWAGDVVGVLAVLATFAARGGDVVTASTYYTYHQARMNYPAYRAQGVQVGSGSIESACKQVVSARLKQAGMIWDAAGAEAVATVRAWLKSDRWTEAMTLRPAPQRRPRRRRAGAPPAAHPSPAAPTLAPAPSRDPRVAAAIAQVKAERAQPTRHPYRNYPACTPKSC